MDYTLDIYYIGRGETLREAISDALAQRAQGWTLAEAQAWGRALVQREFVSRKQAIFAAASGYETVELMEMLAEARDYRISGNTNVGRYPLAQALATARGVTTVTVLTGWGNAFAAAFASLATLIHRQDQALDAINGAASLMALRDVMATILEQLG